MLPVARKPVVQYVIEELVANGLEQILFVTGRSKTAIENHFDFDELPNELKAKYFYTRQSVQRGLGDAVLCGEHFAGDEPFVVALGDSILGLNAQSRTVARMIEIFQERSAACVLAVEEVPREETRYYGIIEPAGKFDGAVRVAKLIEKPQPDEAPSTLAIAGRYAFAPAIFEEIRRVRPDKRGEIQLTDAIDRMCQYPGGVYAVPLASGEKRYDIGNFPSYFETFLEFALADPEFGSDLRGTLERLLAARR
jgi:UTP--glucose-1-phosphate uridylyltransferase